MAGLVVSAELPVVGRGIEAISRKPAELALPVASRAYRDIEARDAYSSPATTRPCWARFVSCVEAEAQIANTPSPPCGNSV
ncbi:MAG: hypothetical protein NVS3B26_15290 [Mycobacteriales bacterium]